MKAEQPLRMASIHANTTGTVAGSGASDAFVAVRTMLPTNWGQNITSAPVRTKRQLLCSGTKFSFGKSQLTHQIVSQEKITNSTFGGSWIVEQYSSVYQIMVMVRTIKAIVAQVSCTYKPHVKQAA